MVMMLHMGVKTLHVHHHAQGEKVVCSDCEHHRVHNGHLISWDGGSDDCPLCHMLTTPGIPYQHVRLTILPTLHLVRHAAADGIVAAGDSMTHYRRGPPCLLFL